MIELDVRGMGVPPESRLNKPKTIGQAVDNFIDETATLWGPLMLNILEESRRQPRGNEVVSPGMTIFRFISMM